MKRRAPTPFAVVRELHDLLLLVNDYLISVEILSRGSLRAVPLSADACM